MRGRFGSVARAVAAAIAAALVFAILSQSGGIEDRVGWRLAIVSGLCVIALYYTSKAFVEVWRRETDQLRWGDTVAVIAEAPRQFGPGATGVVEEVRYLSGIRVCLVAFDHGSNVVPERFLEKVIDGGKAWNRA